MPKISGYIADGYTLGASNNTWTFDASTLIKGENAIAETSTLQNNIINLFGHVVAENYGLLLAGDKTRLTTSASSIITGGFGISLGGDGQILKLHGDIDAGTGISDSGDNARITNFGKIIANVGIRDIGEGTVIVNAKSGLIHAETTAIRMDDMSSHLHSEVYNHGTISVSAGGHAYIGGKGPDYLFNDGSITGKIDLGDLPDTFDTLHGSFTGVLAGGRDNDTLVTGSADIILVEIDNEGTDTVKSSATYVLNVNVENLTLLGKRNIDGTGNDEFNVMIGNSGDNDLFGGIGNDTLNGGRGNDFLRGGETSGEFDTFIFKTGFGHDTIVDMEILFDQVVVTGWKSPETCHERQWRGAHFGRPRQPVL